MSELVRFGELLRHVATFGLPGATLAPQAPVAPDGEWDAVLASISADHLTGLAVAALEAGALQVTEEALEDLLARHRAAMVAALGLERTLLELTTAFEDQGLDYVVLKGPAVAHTGYPDPSWRPFNDLDILVRTGDWRPALGLLANLGLRRRLPEPRPGFDERFGKAATHVTPDGQEIDLHRTLAEGPFGLWIDPNELFDHVTTFRLGGRRLPRLDDSALLAHACVHAVLGQSQPLLYELRDIAQVLAVGRVDWELIARWAEQWRLAVVLEHAFALTGKALGMQLPHEAQEALAMRLPRFERRVLEAYTTPKRYRGAVAMSTIGAIRGVWHKAAYIRALLLPGEEFLSSRAGNGHRSSYLLRWRTPIRWLTRR
jgi:Uncharacterised nucleotidyltransferase